MEENIFFKYIPHIEIRNLKFVNLNRRGLITRIENCIMQKEIAEGELIKREKHSESLIF